MQILINIILILLPVLVIAVEVLAIQYLVFIFIANTVDFVRGIKQLVQKKRKVGFVEDES